jgi:uncharacterized membrane protein
MRVNSMNKKLKYLLVVTIIILILFLINSFLDAYDTTSISV